MAQRCLRLEEPFLIPQKNFLTTFHKKTLPTTNNFLCNRKVMFMFKVRDGTMQRDK